MCLSSVLSELSFAFNLIAFVNFSLANSVSQHVCMMQTYIQSVRTDIYTRAQTQAPEPFNKDELG